MGLAGRGQAGKPELEKGTRTAMLGPQKWVTGRIFR